MPSLRLPKIRNSSNNSSEELAKLNDQLNEAIIQFITKVFPTPMLEIEDIRHHLQSGSTLATLGEQFIKMQDSCVLRTERDWVMAIAELPWLTRLHDAVKHFIGIDKSQYSRARAITIFILCEIYKIEYGKEILKKVVSQLLGSETDTDIEAYVYLQTFLTGQREG